MFGHQPLEGSDTILFATLDVLQGTMIGRCMQRHRNGEFIRFLNAVEAAVPAGKRILDNYATHKHPKVRAWLVSSVHICSSLRPVGRVSCYHTRQTGTAAEKCETKL